MTAFFYESEAKLRSWTCPLCYTQLIMKNNLRYWRWVCPKGSREKVFLISVADSGGTLNYVDTPIYRRDPAIFHSRVQTWVRRLRIRKFPSLISGRLIIGAINTGNTCPLLAIFFYPTVSNVSSFKLVFFSRFRIKYFGTCKCEWSFKSFNLVRRGKNVTFNLYELILNYLYFFGHNICNNYSNEYILFWQL